MKRRLILLGLCLIGLMTGCRTIFDNRARVIIDNQSECGTIPVRLTNTKDKNDIKTDRVPVGERHEIVVAPDVPYEYLIDFTGAGQTSDDYRCTATESGTVKVPAGTSQTFTLDAKRASPTPVPTLIP